MSRCNLTLGPPLRYTLLVVLLSSLSIIHESARGAPSNHEDRSIAEALFSPFPIRNLSIEPGGKSAGDLEVTLAEAGLRVDASGVFAVEGTVEKDLSGYQGVELEIEAEGGLLTLEIEDCLGNVWSSSHECEKGRQRVRYSFEDFRFVQQRGAWHLPEPASVETLTLRVQPDGNRENRFAWYAFGPFGSKGLAGPSTGIDPFFELYQERPVEEIADIVKGQGYTNAVIIFTREMPEARHREIVDAFHAVGLQCSLRINPPTDFEAYEEHPEWRQKMLDGSSRFCWRVYLCPNREEFADWYCDKIAAVLRSIPYDALLISESWFEVWGGAYQKNANRGKYACLCEACVSEFRDQTGIDATSLFDEDSPEYFEKPGNGPGYKAWCDFRVDTVSTFCRRIAEAARDARPSLQIGYMYLADCTVEPGGTREYQAQDLERALKASGADIAVIQDAWQDWIKEDLSPDFVQKYAEAYLERMREVRSDLVLQVHADVGSRPEMKRSGLWMRQLSAYARLAGFHSPMFYEFSLNWDGD